MAVARPSSGRVTKSSGEESILGFLFPIDNALYSIAFGTHTKMAKLIEMLFGMISWLVVVTIPKGEWVVLGERAEQA